MNLVRSRCFELALLNRKCTFSSNDFIRLHLFVLIFYFHPFRLFSMNFTYFHLNCWIIWWMTNDDSIDRLQHFQLKWNRIKFWFNNMEKYVFRKRWKMIEQHRNWNSMFRNFNWFRMNEFQIAKIPIQSHLFYYKLWGNICEHGGKYV